MVGTKPETMNCVLLIFLQAMLLSLIFFPQDLQMQLVDPEEMPAMEQLTQEVLMLREKVARVELQGQEASGSNRKQQV